MKRRAKLSDGGYPVVFNPGVQKAAAPGNYVRRPQPVYPASISGEAARREAARRANERRRKAFDAVVLEDVQDRAKGKGKGKENERGVGGGWYGGKPLPRSDVRLPRSPGMLNLAQQKLESLNISPETAWALPRLPEPMIEEDFGDDGDGFDEIVERGLLNRPLRDMNRTYADGMDFAPEAAEMEFEVEEREKEKSLWEEKSTIAWGA